MALGRFLDKLKGVVAPIAKVAAPIVGSAIAGPLGGILAGGLTKGLTTKGSFGDKLKGGLKGAAIGAATTGAMSALKGAVTGSQAAGAAANPALAQAGNAANTAAKAATAAPAAAAGGFGQIDPNMAAKTMFAPSAAAPAVQGTFNPALTQAAASGAVPTGPDPVVMSAGAPNLSQPSLPSITSEVRGQMIAPEGYMPMGQRAQLFGSQGGTPSPTFGSAGLAGPSPTTIGGTATSNAAASQAGRMSEPTGFRFTAPGGTRDQFLDAVEQQGPEGAGQVVNDLYELSERGKQASMAADGIQQIPSPPVAGPSVTPTTPNLEVPTFETPGIDVTMPEPPSLAPPPMMIEQGSGRNRLMSMFSGIGNFAKENPELAMGIAQGLQGAFAQDPREREFEYQMKLRARKADLIRQMGLLDDFSV